MNASGFPALPKATTAERAERRLLEVIEAARPDVVAIDAPLTLPPCLTCPTFCRGPGADLCELQAARDVWERDGHPVTERLCEVLLRDELDAGPLPTMHIAQIAARGVSPARRILAGGTRMGAPGGRRGDRGYPYATLARLGRDASRLRPREAVAQRAVVSGPLERLAAWRTTSWRVTVSSRFCCRRTSGSGCRRITSRGSSPMLWT